MSHSLNEIARNDPRLLQPLELYAKSKINCLQAVMMPFVKDDSPELQAALVSMTKPLGGGVAGMGYVCGALLAALMVLSRKLDADNWTAQESERTLREFCRQFGEQYSTLFCSGIKALAGKEREYEVCQVLVVNTIDSIDRFLDHKKSSG